MQNSQGNGKKARRARFCYISRLACARATSIAVRIRKHCSNGVIFEEEVATIRASHSKGALDQLKIEITSRTLAQIWDEFSKVLPRVRSIEMTTAQATLALNAVFNTLTDIAARPPKNPHFLKNRDTIEKRSGRWLKDLAGQSQVAGFDLNAWIASWKAGGSVRHIPGKT
jgi:hypothetical protein